MLRDKQIGFSRRRLRQRLRASQMRSVQWRAGPEAAHSNFHPEDGVHVRDSRLNGEITSDQTSALEVFRTAIWVRLQQKIAELAPKTPMMSAILKFIFPLGD